MRSIASYQFLLLTFVGMNQASAFLPNRIRRFATSLGGVKPRKIAIIGGGLAGLSTLFHLQENDPNLQITVLDRAKVGTSGASSVAGGLVHPLSPRGRLVPWGREALQATDRLVKQAHQMSPTVVLREEIYRVALSEENVHELQQTAHDIPDMCQWVDAQDMRKLSGDQHNHHILGALRLSNGCQVIHLPSYLENLWKVCQQQNTGGSLEWKILGEEWCLERWKQELTSFDTIVLSAGSGMFEMILPASSLPVQLVRGQSVEVRLNPGAAEYSNLAYLCGKYVSPMPDDNFVLVGATQEFKNEKLPKDEVIAELKSRTYDMLPIIWDQGGVDRVTVGYRVQSSRGKLGRRPIVGRLPLAIIDWHPNAWVFTGLSSRGLLNHALYGKLLAGAILAGSEHSLVDHPLDLLWWQKK